jgi:ABC-type branched-subunit amino acid transport system substrate-binding protein
LTEVLDQLRTARCDTLLITMVGQDAVEFTRAFARAGLTAKVLRLSCATEENQLLAIGADNTENLHVALGYFESLQTDANLSFKERYRERFGERAPPLNSLGQSLYEGMHFLAALLRSKSVPWRLGSTAPLAYASAREAVHLGAGVNQAPMYLARAEALSFRVIKRF